MSGLLLALLAAHGQRVGYVPGRTVNQMASARRGEAKTDARDAYVIAETLRHPDNLAEVEVAASLATELRLLVTHRTELVGDPVPHGQPAPRRAQSAEPAMNAALSVRNLHTHFFTKEGVAKAVDGVDFDVAPGEVLGLVGESGSGKTVTGFSILGLIASLAVASLAWA